MSNRAEHDKDAEGDSMKENIVKGDRTKRETAIDIIEYVPQFDTSCADLIPNFPYILEIDNVNTGDREKHVVVITNIMNDCIYCNKWNNLGDDAHSGIVLMPEDFNKRNAVLYKITGDDLKMNNEEKGFGKIVDDLTIADLKKYEKDGISILLVRNPLTKEVSKAVSESKIHVYADLDPRTISIARMLIKSAK